MKKISFLLLIPCLFLLAATAFAQQKIKVACIGNSITAGYGIRNKAAWYPNQLQQLLGDNYSVMNYGVSGRTLLKKGDRPYWKEKALADAKAWLPDIVVIKLGTNDSKPVNWTFKSEFEQDCTDLAREFESLPSKPKVFLCYPMTVFKNNFGIQDSVITADIIPMIARVAKSEKLPVIDLHEALKSFGSHAADGVHPDSIGAAEIAKIVYKAIVKK